MSNFFQVNDFSFRRITKRNPPKNPSVDIKLTQKLKVKTVNLVKMTLMIHLGNLVKLLIHPKLKDIVPVPKPITKNVWLPSMPVAKDARNSVPANAEILVPPPPTRKKVKEKTF